MQSQQSTLMNQFHPLNNETQKLINDCKGKSFLQFNEIIGLPVKDEENKINVEHPIYDYEINILNEIKKNQHVWILKSRGLGITELILRYFAWLCLSSNYYEGKFIHIITGTKEQFAAKLILRLENIFKKKYPNARFQARYTELLLNRTLIQAFPTKQLKDLRGHIDVSYMFIDEADFFDKKEQEELPYVIKSYEEKSNAKVIMVSTPNRPDGLFHAIETGDVFKGFFTKLKLNYEIGLDKIYQRKFIEREMHEPEFEREYNLQYLGRIGNVFSSTMINKAIELGEKYAKLPVNQYALHLGACDPGFGKVTPIYIAELDTENHNVRIIYYEGFDNTSTPEQIANRMHDLHLEYRNLKWFVDGSNRGFVNQIKTKYREPTGWEDGEELNPSEYKVLPVHFRNNHKKLLENTYNLMSLGKIAIPKKYDRLIIALRTAWATEWDLNKDETVNDDDLDTLRLLLKHIKFGKKD